MPLQNFVANSLPTIKAAWLNAVDAMYFTLFNAATTAAQARTAINIDTFATTATAAGTTTLVLASAQIQEFTGTTTQTIVLPDVTTLTAGHHYDIINNSTGALTINSSGGNLVQTLGAGARATITCILASGTTAASWGVGFYLATTAAGAVSTNGASLTAGAISGTGLFDISGAVAGQIKFPATQNASSDANTLDDYEEGTFTPNLTFGGGSIGLAYDNRFGTYTKIGNRVFCSFRISLTAKGSSTGVANIAGLPYAANSTANNYISFAFGISGAMASMSTLPVGQIAPSAFTIDLYQMVTSTYESLTNANFTDTTFFNVQFQYFV